MVTARRSRPSFSRSRAASSSSCSYGCSAGSARDAAPSDCPMFPEPIARRPRALPWYRAAVLAALLVWLLPLLAVALTSLRSQEDINRGNFWGWPTDVQLLENYASVLM